MTGDNIVRIEGARLIFRNFSGRPGRYNAEGRKTFGVILPSDDVAEDMLADGWNVKRLKPTDEEREEGIEVGPPWLDVKVNYESGRPPRIFAVTKTKKTLLTDETVAQLDGVDIESVDLSIRASAYDTGTNKGIAAYVRTMYVLVHEDPLDEKYADLETQ